MWPLSDPTPDFLAGSGLATEAFEFAAEAHRGQDRKGDGAPYIRHPIEVARLLTREGVEDEVLLAAAFLHDVVEDTEVSLEEVRERFGPEVFELVNAMTEDKTIEPYLARKEHHRDQIEAAGPQATRIYAADKLANLRDMRSLYASEGEGAAGRFNAPIDVRMELWRGDLALAQRLVPELGFVDELRSELDAFDAERATTAQS